VLVYIEKIGIFEYFSTVLIKKTGVSTGFHFGSMLKKIIAERNYARVQITNAMGTTAPVLYAYLHIAMYSR
jgi:hypothetical protein